MNETNAVTMSRRGLLALGAAALVPAPLRAAPRGAFADWVETFRPRARARGISDEIYTRVMGALKPDTSVYSANQDQPEVNEVLWKYLNRRVSAWRIMTGQARAREHAGLLDRLERDYGVDRSVLLGLWGMESAFGEVVTDRKYMRPVLPALAALAWGEPRRRAYWEQELLNALLIIERRWSTPEEMIGSWAGAMGHTQWMPEAWLNIGVDYDRDGRVSPFGRPDDALAGAARYLAQRGKYRRGEIWGGEVRTPPQSLVRRSDQTTRRSVAAWRDLGLLSIDERFPLPFETEAALWIPMAGGPAFLLAQNFFAVRSYNPSSKYALALLHLADRIRGGGPFVQSFPASERALTLAEMQELQQRLVALGHDPGHTDGRAGLDMTRAVQAVQRRLGLQPPDGYPGLQVLTRLRQGL
jgi:peptidoglycan lytic transglycosylase B